MSFGQAIKTCFKKYFVILGRAPRSEYWWFQLFLAIVGGTLAIIALGAGAGALFTAFSGDSSSAEDFAGLALFAVLIGLVAFFFFLAIIIPSVTVMVRRFHDVGLSGWWIGGYWIANVVVGFISTLSLGGSSDAGSAGSTILGLILNLAGIGLFIVTLLPSQSGTNKYGPHPLGMPGDFSTPPPPPGDYKSL